MDIADFEKYVLEMCAARCTTSPKKGAYGAGFPAISNKKPLSDSAHFLRARGGRGF